MAAEIVIPEEFNKIIKDFVADIITTFPEYQAIIDKWWKVKETDDTELRYQLEKQKIHFIFEHCVKIFPERFFDILYQKTEIFESDSVVNTEFLPGISFKYLWQCEISEKTRETIWKYLQMILISIIGTVQNKEAFGDNSKLFDSLNEDEFKGKLEETLENMQQIFENMTQDNSSQESTESEQPEKNMPSADDIHSHISGMLGGKLGDLAREIAEETASTLNIDMENVTDAKDILQKLFTNPGKLMSMVKNVGDKLDSKMKAGDIKESELMSEASDILNKMKNMPGMGNIQDLLGKMGGLGPIGGKNAKVDVNAMEQQLKKNMQNAEMKERMRKKMEMNKQAKLMSQVVSQQQYQNTKPLSDEELVSMFNTSEKGEKTPRLEKNNVDSSSKKKKKGKK